MPKQLLALLVIAGALPVFAGPGRAFSADLKEVEAHHTKAYRDCPGFKSGVDPEMIDCITAETDIQDKRLNAAYARALAVLSPKRKTALREAQRAWVAYRDKWCGITYDEDSGSLERIEADQCVLEQTVLQTMNLEVLAKGG
jgi:uncharacterized protein YecT (DUF1311 family)